MNYSPTPSTPEEGEETTGGNKDKYGVGVETKLEESVEESSSESSEEKQKTGIYNFFKNLTNKEITESDLEPVLEKFSNHLIEKNVAVEVAREVCKSLGSGLVGKNLSSFTSLTTSVKTAMEESLTRILTPKKKIDILRDIKLSKEEGNPYSIVFIGVNGVVKSTTLAKVCSWLLQNNFTVLIAACDTFRSGSVEQLEVHARNLNVPLHSKGYGKDASSVAFEALNRAKKEGIDVVLIDTAGRMQGKEQPMQALAKLVDFNKPSLVLFIGEAIVGNDSVDQLRKFNRVLIEYSRDKNPRGLDGIILTKFDTVDEKVGAAISMVYTTGQPIVFVGTGQEYPDLKVLNVKKVVSILIKGKI